ncbi:MAG: HAD family hydrolase [Pseudomonadota bacterium]
MIELVIFDCDGVLIDSEGLSAEVLLSELAALGLALDMDYFCAHFMGRSFPTVAEDIRDRFDLVLPETFEASYRARLLRAFEARLQPTNGVVEVIEALAVPACVATSSSPKRASNSLRIARLTEYFPGVVFTASEVARGKPAPDLFLHTAARMGVRPEACLVIEDSLPGIAAGVAAGMRVLRYTGGSHLAGRMLKHGADVEVFDKWSDFFEIFPELKRDM